MSDRPTISHCPICRDTNFTYQFTHADLPIVRCDGCTLLMRNPQPSDAELEAIYGADYFLGTSDGPEHDRFDKSSPGSNSQRPPAISSKSSTMRDGIVRRGAGAGSSTSGLASAICSSKPWRAATTRRASSFRRAPWRAPMRGWAHHSCVRERWRPWRLLMVRATSAC